ncbi:MAG: hypothetical protein EAZ37_13860 [Burkholderiales bacterium]|nr:MAG: hypothetical protein EAZ37_13860 [Burkholderiales bacterium]
MLNLYYTRTVEGQAAAYDATSAMPRKLKSLLKVIDGKTSLDVFANSLKAFGDVQGLLVSLQKAGLIELRQTTVETAAPMAAPSASAETGLVGTIASKIGLRSGRSSADASGFALTQAHNTQPHTIRESRTHSPERQQERQQDLQLLVQDMSSFVLAYVPEQAFGVLSELEQINTVEQMAVLLGGYELMIRHTGEPAHIHILHVRQTLSKWL